MSVSALVANHKSALVEDIVNICTAFLRDTGPTREAASACISSLLTRPDMDNHLLFNFVSASCSKIGAWSKKSAADINDLTTDSFEIIGVMHAISQIFKKGHRGRILPHCTSVLPPCLALAAQSNQLIVRKLTCKLAQRIGMTFLPPRVAAWRYQRGSRSLVSNLAGATDKEGEAAAAVNAAIAAGSGSTEGEDIDADVPDELEDIVDHLLTSLQDKDTIVRWNAAKGIGRITMRLSRDLGDDVVGAVLELFDDGDADSAWHGGCLALAELTRRGLLLPERLSEVMPLIERAIHFDVVRGQHSVGAHVRDAACYVCWAFARAYSPEVMSPFISSLASSMLITCTYDREINCRRAASAAFQENVGRQGNENFPHGIEIITIADYFSLGNRTHAYIHVAPHIARLNDDNHAELMYHLADVKVSHWDVEIRRLSSRALAALTPINPTRALEVLKDLLKTCFSQSFTARHGAVLCVAELVLALVQCDAVLPTELVEEISALVPKLDKSRLFRGKGGELLRSASCTLIEHIARAQLDFNIKTKVALVEFLNENLRNPQEFIQEAATDALRELLFSYFAQSEGDPSDRLQKITTLLYTNGLNKEENVAVTRGYALAVGVLPYNLLCKPVGRIDMVLDCLHFAAKEDRKFSGDTDAETRRNAVSSVVEICERLCLTDAFDSRLVQRCFDMMMRASNDHSVDKRGDTGSWSRIASIRGMQRIIYAVLRHSAFLGNAASATKMNNTYHMTSLGCAISFPRAGSAFSAVHYPASSYGRSCVEKDQQAKGNTSANTEAASNSDTGVFLVHSDRVRKISSAEPAAAAGTGAGEEMYSSVSEYSQRYMGVLLAQLAEKLDSVREVSGKCLEGLLSDCSSGQGQMQDTWNMFVPGVIDRQVIASAIKVSTAPVVATDTATATATATAAVGEERNINWAHPAHVFPILRRIMESKAYLNDLLGGMVIAIGGLSATVVRESTAALLQFCSDKKASVSEKDGAYIELVCESLIEIFSKFAKTDRVIVPLLKTVNVLLRNGIFDSIRPHNSSFPLALLSRVQEESTSSNTVKIKMCIDILLLMLQMEEPIRLKALKVLIVFLGHRFPSVRKYAADALYVQFLSDKFSVGDDEEAIQAILSARTNVGTSAGEGKDEVEATVVPTYIGLARSNQVLSTAQDLLASTQWDGSQDVARTKRQELCTMLGLKMGVRAVDASKKKKTEIVKDELDSYESLVREVGY